LDKTELRRAPTEVKMPARREREPMAEYRIDDLARAAGITARRVRAHQERGLLPPPEKRGRDGYYNDSHLVGLKLIDSLLSRGFTTAHAETADRSQSSAPA
jgi:DNA-binding transcriptional MerR regulator